MQCAPNIFNTDTRMCLSIQLLVNKKFFHQSSFKFIQISFISPASIYATLFIKFGVKKVRGDLETYRTFENYKRTIVESYAAQERVLSATKSGSLILDKDLIKNRASNIMPLITLVDEFQTCILFLADKNHSLQSLGLLLWLRQS